MISLYFIVQIRARNTNGPFGPVNTAFKDVHEKIFVRLRTNVVLSWTDGKLIVETLHCNVSTAIQRLHGNTTPPRQYNVSTAIQCLHGNTTPPRQYNASTAMQRLHGTATSLRDNKFILISTILQDSPSLPELIDNSLLTG